MQKTNNLAKEISIIENISLLKIQSKNLVKKEAIVFALLLRHDIESLLITKPLGENALCLAVRASQARIAKETLEKNAYSVALDDNLAIITLAGSNMKGAPGVSSKFFRALAKNGVNVIAIAQGSSESNISAAVSSQDARKAKASIQDAFSLIESRPLNLFIVGTGLIGKTLLSQITSELNNLKNNHNIEIKLRGLANSQKMVLAKDGFEIENWEGLIKTGEKTNIAQFARAINQYNLPNSVFVDCTASEEIPKHYEYILKNYISIVTPNKKANSSSFKEYEKLKELAREKNISFLYETNVGAGLPIINTLRDLIASGDKILKIEGALSGTLSYIFNNFSQGEMTFSDIVMQAQKKGYTEPDPRDDLNGMDVARKILILAREAGIKLELEEIELESLIAKECEKADSVDKFFAVLKTMDKDFEEKKTKASSQKKVLRYIAKLENGKAKVSLETVGQNHPFYSLSGSDNMISFTTTRYNETPLVVKGPGAGAAVTAGGVLADIIRIVK